MAPIGGFDINTESDGVVTIPIYSASYGSSSIIIDSFEDTDLSEYTGDTGDFAVIEPSGFSPIDGDYVLEGSHSGGTSQETHYIESSSGLNHYPQKGEEHDYWVRATTWDAGTGVDYFKIAHKYNGPDDKYFVKFGEDVLQIWLEESDNSTSDSALHGIGTNDNGWYRINVKWDDGSTFGGASGEQTVTLYDYSGNQVAQVSATDDNFSGGGPVRIEYQIDGDSEAVYCDYWHGGSSASSTTIDSFEDQDWSEYTAEKGSKSNWNFNTSDAKDGTVSAELPSTAGTNKLFSTSGLGAYPSQGDRIEFWVYHSIGSSTASTCLFGLYYGGTDSDNCYLTRHRPDNSRLQIWKNVGGTAYLQAEKTGVSLPAGWYKWIIEWDDGSTFGGSAGDHNVTVEDSNGNTVETLSGNDTDYTSGGVGLWGYVESGEYLLWDGVKITTGDSGSGPSSSTIDSFEDQDWGEYTALSGNKSDFTFNTSKSQDGSVSAELAGDTGYPKLYSTSGLDNYPSQGDRIEFWVYNSIGTSSASTCEFGVYYGGTDDDNTYFIKHHVDDGSIQVWKDVSSNQTRIQEQTGISFSAGWYKWIIEWDDGSTFGGSAGDQNITVEDSDGNTVGTLSINDTAYTSGGFGVWGAAESGEYVLWDGVKITNVSTGGGGTTTGSEKGTIGSNVLDAFRVNTETGTGFVPLTDKNDAAYPFLRVHTDQGTKAVHSGVKVYADPNEAGLMEDFEPYLDLNDGYDGDVGEWSLQSDAMSSTYGQQIGSNTGDIFNTQIGGSLDRLKTPRGYEYEFKFADSGNSGWESEFLVNVQNPSDPGAGAFSVWMGETFIALAEWSSGSLSSFTTKSISLGTGNEYIVRVQLYETDQDMSAQIWYSSDDPDNDSPVVDIGPATPPNYSYTGGHLGFTATVVSQKYGEVRRNSLSSSLTSATWSTQSDWDSAQSREGVVSRDINGYSPDTLALGYDPQHGIPSNFDSFWTLGEASSPWQDEVSTIDLTFDNSGSSGSITTGAQGILGKDAIHTDEFNVGVASPPNGISINPGNDFTMGFWVYYTSFRGTFEATMAMDDQSNTESVSLGNSSGDFKIGSVGNTPGTGQALSENQWYFLVLRYDSANNLLEGFVDGSKDYDVNPSNGSNWLPNLDEQRFGRRAFGDSSNAHMDKGFAMQGQLTDSEIQTLYDVSSGGNLTTAEKSRNGEATELETDATVPTNTSITITVYQDTSGDGNADNSEQVSIGGGVNQYPLSNFTATGSDYWVKADLSTSDIESSPELNEVVLR